jgi:hypothetical protein
MMAPSGGGSKPDWPPPANAAPAKAVTTRRQANNPMRINKRFSMILSFSGYKK